MTNSGQLDPIVFRLTRGQRTARLIGAAIFGLMGIAGIWLGAPLGGVALFWDAVPLLIALYLLNMQAGRTTIDAHGIHAWRPVRRRSCPWSQVSDITYRVMSCERNDIARIEIQRKNRRKFRLPAPIGSTANGESPLFKDQLETIRNYRDTAARRAPDQLENLPG